MKKIISILIISCLLLTSCAGAVTGDTDTREPVDITYEDELIIPGTDTEPAGTDAETDITINTPEDTAVPGIGDTTEPEATREPETIRPPETTVTPEEDIDAPETELGGTDDFGGSGSETNKEEIDDTTELPEETTEAETEKIPVETEPVVNFTEVNETVYVTGNVNIRELPTTESNILGVFKKGEALNRVGIGDNGWSKIIWNGQEVYCSSGYVSTTKPEPEITYPLVYSDETATITITREWYGNAWCYIAHLEFTDYTRLATEVANGKYNNGYETTSHAAKRLGAIFAVNGCYSAPKLNYTVIRDGVVWNGGQKSLILPGVYNQNDGIFYNAWEGHVPEIFKGQTVQQLVDAGLVTDSFCFGPPMLIDGKNLGANNYDRAQRTFMGTNGNPGDIWVVVSDGRKNDGESSGLNYYQCGQLLLEKGCTFGICLDGGGSSTMVFNGKVLNANGKNERAVVDFLYFK